MTLRLFHYHDSTDVELTVEIDGQLVTCRVNAENPRLDEAQVALALLNMLARELGSKPDAYVV